MVTVTVTVTVTVNLFKCPKNKRPHGLPPDIRLSRLHLCTYARTWNLAERLGHWQYRLAHIAIMNDWGPRHNSFQVVSLLAPEWRQKILICILGLLWLLEYNKFRYMHLAQAFRSCCCKIWQNCMTLRPHQCSSYTHTIKSGITILCLLCFIPRIKNRALFPVTKKHENTHTKATQNNTHTHMCTCMHTQNTRKRVQKFPGLPPSPAL